MRAMLGLHPGQGMRNREHAHHAAADAVPGGAERPLRGESLGESNITSLIPVAKARSGSVAATVWWISRRAESFLHRFRRRCPAVRNQHCGRQESTRRTREAQFLSLVSRIGWIPIL